MKILITGGAGFIGSQLGRFLSNKHDIFSLDNLSYGNLENLRHKGSTFSEFIKCDIRDDNFHEFCKGMDVVVHLAGIAPLPESQINPVNAYDNNVIGTLNVLESCKKHGVKKVIFSSTSAVYENSKTYPLAEDTGFENPDLIYSMTKLACENLCSSYVKNYDMDITVIRFFNVYGPNQDHLRKQPPLLGYITKCLLENKNPVFYSSGEQKRDYIYVDDVSRLIEKCFENESSQGQIFNACSGNTYSVKEIYELFKKHFGSDLECRFEEPKNFWDKYPSLFEGTYPLKRERIVKEVNKFSLGTYKKATDLLNWSPQVSLSEGIKKCLKEIE